MRLLTRTGYGWTCTPCRINAGDPDHPFHTEDAAEVGLDDHIRSFHAGVAPDEVWAGPIAWRRFPLIPTLIRFPND